MRRCSWRATQNEHMFTIMSCISTGVWPYTQQTSTRINVPTKKAKSFLKTMSSGKRLWKLIYFIQLRAFYWFFFNFIFTLTHFVSNRNGTEKKVSLKTGTQIRITYIEKQREEKKIHTLIIRPIGVDYCGQGQFSFTFSLRAGCYCPFIYS